MNHDQIQERLSNWCLTMMLVTLTIVMGAAGIATIVWLFNEATRR